MGKQEFILSCVMVCCVITTSCTQNRIADNPAEPTTVAIETKQKTQHSYGGWYCPDNFGFPPVNIQDLDKVTVVTDRLPTREETRNGTSLMYIDPAEYPDAKPLDIKLPRVARKYSNHSDIDELIIVIQAVVIGQDTVVGYRYPDGGNGSAWLSEVTFLSDREVADIGPTPYVYLKTEIDANTEEIWKGITQTAFARSLGERFNKKSFFASEWSNESTAHLHLATDSVTAAGIVTIVYGNLYMQIDYDYNGFHFSEKILVIENIKEEKSELHFVSGPYPDDFMVQSVSWNNWVKEVKTLSETN